MTQEKDNRWFRGVVLEKNSADSGDSTSDQCIFVRANCTTKLTRRVAKHKLSYLGHIVRMEDPWKLQTSML